jgi:hypothetical protein
MECELKTHSKPLDMIVWGFNAAAAVPALESTDWF